MAYSESEKALLMLTNDLLAKVGIDCRVKAVTDISASLLVKFLEHLCDETLTGVIREPKNRNDDIYNLNIILKTLSESLMISLSHISPEKIASGSIKDISNLLEIFSGLIKGQTANTDQDDLVMLANDLLSRAELNIKIQDFSEINSVLFLRLLEKLCRENLSGVISKPKSLEDHIRNLQIVNETLSHVLRTSVSHVSPREVASGNQRAVQHLLEIFSGIVEEGLSARGKAEAFVRLANSILEKAEMSRRVKDFLDINSGFFVDLLVGLCRETITGLVSSPRTPKDEEHNVEVVLQILKDVLGVSLSHINPRDVVSQNEVAIGNLLQVFSGFIEGVLVSESDAKEELDLVKLANRVLVALEMNMTVEKRRDINASVFVQILEQLCDEKLADITREPKDRRDEVRNVEIVLRALADALSISLSYINPQDVVDGNPKALRNLLDVFLGIVDGKPLTNGAESSDESGTKKVDKDDALVKLANDLLSKTNLSLRVKSSGEIDASLYVTLLECLCSEPLSRIVRRPETAADDLHNLKVVIRTLADVLKMSLSHISPQDVMSGNRVATKHLLEVFYGLLEGYHERTKKESEGKLVELANGLLCKAGVDLRVKTSLDINAAFFITLLEHLCSEQNQDVLRRPHSAENDLHNIKVVLKTLSNVLRISLSHISAQDVVDGSTVAVKHLLEVFSGLLEASTKAASDISEEYLVRLANSLLSKVNISLKVKSVKDIRVSLLVNVLEQLCPEGLTGVVRHPIRTEDEIQNVKVVIATLENLLKMSLSHIPASAVVYGNRLAIRNLLDLLWRLADGQETRLKIKRMNGDATVNLANELVGQTRTNIKTLGDINASFFVDLLRRVCSEPITSVIEDPHSQEDEIHNVRVVLNVLSELLQTPLSHISPHEIVLGNRMAINHLLEVFYELPKDNFPLQNFSSSDITKKDDSEIIDMANEMLSKLRISVKIQSIRDINASVFVMLFEGLCAEPLDDVIQHPVAREDEVHNVQAVIDTLSMDVLNTSLAHISSQDIVSGDRSAIANLLEVLYGLMEFILEEIAEESNSEKNIHGPSEEDDDPDLVTSEVIDSVLQSQLGKQVSSQNKSSAVNRDEEKVPANQNKSIKDGQHQSFESGMSSDVCTDRTSDLIQLGDPSQLGNFEKQDVPRSTEATDKKFTQGTIRHSSELAAKENFLRSSRRPDHLSNGHPVSSAVATDPLAVHSVPSTLAELRNYGPPQVDRDSDIQQTSWPFVKDFSSRISTETKATNALVSDHLHSAGRWNADYEEIARDDVRTYVPHHVRSPRTKLTHSTYAAQQPVTTSAAAATSLRSQKFQKRTVCDDKKYGCMLTDLPVTSDIDPCCAKPETYQNYLMKYYGRSSRCYDEDASYLSDGCIDYNYSSDDSHPGSIQRELEACRRKLERKAKAVRFDDYLDDCATGSVGDLRRQFKREDKAVLMRKEFLGKVYQDELDGLEQQVLCDARKTSKEKDKEFRSQAFKRPQTARYKTKKYSAPVSVLLPRSRSGRRSVGRIRKRSSSASPTVGRRCPVKLDGDDILPHLLEEFPYLHLAPSTLSNMWRRASHQIEQLSRSDKDAQRKKTKAQEQIEEAERRQEALLDIMRKDLTHQERLKEAKDRQRHQLAVKAKIREKRLQSARIRKYYDEFHIRQRSKMLKKRTKEELLFKHLFHDGLDIQKDRIREVKKYAKEQREQRAKQQKQELDSLENFYRDQFALLAECLAKERSNTTIRDKAQMKVLEQMKKELRKKMEKEIREFQQRLWQDEDNIYFRELDAERVRRDLRLARCHDKI